MVAWTSRRLGYRLGIMLSIVVVVVVDVVVVDGGLPRRDWSDLNLDEVEEQWKQGDEVHELRTPDEELYLASEYHRQRQGKVPQSQRQGTDHAGKPAMIFVTMVKTNKTNLHGDWDSLANTCQIWADQLVHVGIEIQCYPIVPEDQILVTVKRGWFGQEVFDYLVEQGQAQAQASSSTKPHPQLQEIRWNDRTVRLSLDQK